jgi:hypothetical protein
MAIASPKPADFRRPLFRRLKDHPAPNVNSDQVRRAFQNTP